MKQMKRLISVACLVIFLCFRRPDKGGQCRNERGSDRVAAGAWFEFFYAQQEKLFEKAGLKQPS